MKLIKNLRSAINNHPLLTGLYASWLIFGLLFIAYASAAWFSTTNHFFLHLESMNNLVSKSTKQHANALFYQVDQLENQLQHLESQQLSIEEFFFSNKEDGYDHSFLIAADGKFLYSSFRGDGALKLDLNSIIIPPTFLKAALSKDRPFFIPTISLGESNISQYIPVCRTTDVQNASLVCIALSTRNRQLSWHKINEIQDTAIRVITADNHLLYADPLPMQKRHLVGKRIPPSVDKGDLDVDALIEIGQGHFGNQKGLDDIYRIGSVQYLEEIALFVAISLPTSNVVLAWFQTIIGPALMLIAFVILGGFALRFHNQKLDSVYFHHQLTEDALHEQKSTLKLLFSNLPGIVYRVRIPDYKVLFITDGCQNLLGHSAKTYLSGKRTPFDDIYEEDQEILVKHSNSISSAKSQYEHIFRVNSPSGEMKWILDRGRAVKPVLGSDNEDKTIYLEGILLDITEHMHSQQQVDYLATRDPLTELANRYAFIDELVNRIDEYKEKKDIALLFIDLDRFKTINDSLGHQVGDRLLKAVSERLRKCVGEENHLARLSGDEFTAMMLNPASLEDVEALANKINNIISNTFEIDYYKLNTTCSIGISMYPQDSTESHILLRNADTAMYSAKSNGGNTYHFFTDEMNRRVNNRLSIETELRRAIKNNEFEIHYQPQVSSETGALEGAEALVRWIHPTAGIVSPIDFITIAEEAGLIREIGDWVLEQACRTFKKWNDESELDLSVAVNVSVRQLDNDFTLRVQEILKQTGLKETNLELEITETLLMNNIEDNIRILDSISEQGVRFAMDDFGTGYSSLSYLRQFPISKLKIDRSFVNDITDDPDDEAIIHAIIAMGKTLKLKVIAEGVENHQQLVLLQAMGCDSYQGFFFSRPLKSEDFYEKYIKPAAAELQKRRLF